MTETSTQTSLDLSDSLMARLLENHGHQGATKGRRRFRSPQVRRQSSTEASEKGANEEKSLENRRTEEADRVRNRNRNDS